MILNKSYIILYQLGYIAGRVTVMLPHKNEQFTNGKLKSSLCRNFCFLSTEPHYQLQEES